MSRMPFWPPAAAVELQPRRTRRQVEFVVRDEDLFRLDLPVPQGSGDRLAGKIHEGGRLQAARRFCPADFDLGGLAEQLRFEAETPAEFSARASTNQNPALCRVRVCSGPGLPSPTMRRKPAIDEASKSLCAGAP
jgi:hypothetical protein